MGIGNTWELPKKINKCFFQVSVQEHTLLERVVEEEILFLFKGCGS